MRRRDLLGGLATAAGVSIAAEKESGPVVEALEIARVRVNHRGDWLLLRCKASNGLTGLGDASHGGDPKRQAEFVQKLFVGLRGRSIYDIEWLRQSAIADLPQSSRLAATAVSALEQTLWDLQGKTTGVPVYRLFGGALRQQIRTYATSTVQCLTVPRKALWKSLHVLSEMASTP